MTLTYHSRNLAAIAQLADRTKAAALHWHDYCEQNNINVLITETIRTEEQQRADVKKGVSQTMKSYHLVGQALDFVPIVNGKTDWGAYNNSDVQKAIAYAKTLGFEWGGDWHSFVDKPHLQFNFKGYGTDTFGKWTETKPAVQTTPATKPSGIKSIGKIKIVEVKNAAYIVDRPSVTGENLSTIDRGTVIDISGSVPGWWEVIYNGKRAYVKAEYGQRV
jgi:peptidoglycan LD-endopeptidase CwlK